MNRDPLPSAFGFTRRDALRALGILASGTALLPFGAAAVRAATADPAPAKPLPPTSEPTGNAAIDHSLATFEAMPVVTTKLSDTLALLAGPGGNMLVLAGPAAGGPILVDSGVHPCAHAVAKAAEAFAGKPVATVINTHWHFDHTGGNELFGRQGARIIAHEAVRARLGSDQFIDAFGFTFHPAPAAALPVVTFADSLVLYAGDEEIRLQYVAPAHTDGDIFARFGKANVLHLGDTFFNGLYPFIDYSSRGWIGGMVAAADLALTLCDDKTRIVPGHGPLGDRKALTDARDMLAMVQGRIEKLLDAGKTVDEIVAATPTKDFDEKWGKGFFNGDLFARNAAAGIQRHRQA